MTFEELAASVRYTHKHDDKPRAVGAIRRRPLSRLEHPRRGGWWGVPARPTRAAHSRGSGGGLTDGGVEEHELAAREELRDDFGADDHEDANDRGEDEGGGRRELERP